MARTDVFSETEDPDFVRSPQGKLVPRNSLPEGAQVVNDSNPYQVQTPEQVSQAAQADAPQFDRTRIDAVEGKLGAIRGKLQALSNLDREFSVAGATAARSRSQAQSETLGAMRGGNPRARDAAASTALAAGARSEATIAGNEALGRSAEDDADQRFKLDAMTTAGKLGLNQAAMEVDVSKLDMAATTSYLNNLFADNNTKLQLNDDKAGRVVDYLRDMALLDRDYYAMSLQDRNALQDRLLDRYEIDEATRVGLAQVEASGASALEIFAGLGQAGVQAFGAYYGASQRSGGGGSGGGSPAADYSSNSSQSFSSGADASGGPGFYQGGR